MFDEFASDPWFFFVAAMIAGLVITVIGGVCVWLLTIIGDLMLWVWRAIRARKEEQERIERIRRLRRQVAAWHRSMEWRNACSNWSDRPLSSDPQKQAEIR